MTLPQAHTRLNAIVAPLRPGLSSSELLAIQTQLVQLLDALPPAAEFDTVAEAIRAIAPRLNTQLQQAACDEIRGRTAILGLAVSVLTQVENEAAADARVLSFERPRLVVSGLKNGISLVQELRDAARQGDVDAVGAKAEALLTLLSTLQRTVKIG